ncbi:MAG TPA: hypothetical protein VFS43_36765 [Polyangiaceae bacterium]|nr:hypothetical protein [Polyangiaceae bacterium]
MPAPYLHERPVSLVRDRPVVVLDFLRYAHGIDLAPASLLQLDTADLTDLDPAERRADLVSLCLGEGVHPLYGLIVEVQVAPDPDKPYRWPAYATGLRDRRRCPTDVLVVCVDDALARSFAAPIRLGYGPSVARAARRRRSAHPATPGPGRLSDATPDRDSDALACARPRAAR